ncbi:MAG: hypothetical protein K1X74_18840 [Pirellulales bacterium]|nr:hypothetical protein [Pirellulales bacterium]
MEITETLARLYAGLTPVPGELHGHAELLSLGDPAGEAEALSDGLAIANLSSRTRVALRGNDRATFLHNLCTNEIRRRAAGEGCEAFLTDAHGRVLGHVFVYVGEEAILLDTVPDQGATIVAHLDRYLIRERVELNDRTEDWGELLLAGPEAENGLQRQGVELPATPLSCRATALAGREVWVCRTAWVRSPAFSLIAPRENLEVIGPHLVGAGAKPVGLAAIEAERIAAGSPWYGVDITAKTLPQEVARDDRTISFTKGCYIGQETVARLDALGHVNKTLCGVVFDSREPPAPGTTLTLAGQEVGQVTSAAYLPRLERAVGLGFVRREAHAPGTVLECGTVAARVAQLPL